MRNIGDIMAGIGFTLKKLFTEESFTQRTKAYLYSALVAAGPWIAAVLTVNALVILSQWIIETNIQRDLFMGTIVYSFVFSQILTAPWQLVITRYISDKLYLKTYEYIKPSSIGLTKLVGLTNLAAVTLFYFNKDLPIPYKLMSIMLFVILTMIWIIMVYLSAVKDYGLIAKAYILGGVVTLVLGILFANYPLPFADFQAGSNLLFSYITGMTITLIILAYTFFGNFKYGNNMQYDFLRILDKYPSLFMIGLFYTTGLWIDDILMWFSFVGVSIYNTYLYAPLYDNAIFLAYLTIIPTMVLFIVSIEIEFYDTYKKYYSLVNGNGTYRQILIANKEMRRSLYRQVAYTFEIQALLSLTLILTAPQLFFIFGGPIIVRSIFQISAVGALFNIFVFVIMLIMLYFEARVRAVLITVCFFVTNLFFTLYFIPFGLEFYGYGFMLSSITTFIFASTIAVRFLRSVDYVTFAKQPLFNENRSYFFTWLADRLNARMRKSVKKNRKLRRWNREENHDDAS